MPHNVPFAILGAGLLWFGWLGFNGGSALAANGLAAFAFANTFVAPAAAALTWGLIELFLHGRMSGVGLASGAVAGMVAITPAAGYVTPLASVLLGGLAAGASFLAVRVRPKLGLDDSLDVFAVHGVAATLGALLTGVLATKAVNPDAADGSLALLGVQAIGVVATLAWSGVLSFALFKLVGLVTPLRAEEQDEWTGPRPVGRRRARLRLRRRAGGWALIPGGASPPPHQRSCWGPTPREEAAPRAGDASPPQARPREEAAPRAGLRPVQWSPVYRRPPPEK